MYILPTLTYLEVGGAAGASEIICFGHFKWEPIGGALNEGPNVLSCLGRRSHSWAQTAALRATTQPSAPPWSG